MRRPAIRVRRAGAVDAVACDAYVEAHPCGTPYQTSGWIQALQRNFGHRDFTLVARRGDRLCGILPLLLVESRLTGARLVSTPLASYGGALADDAGVAAELVARAKIVARGLGVGHLELRDVPGRAVRDPAGSAEAAEARASGSSSASGLLGKDLYYGFREPLPDSPEDVLGWLPRKCRRMVRLGHRAGLTARRVDWSGGRDEAAGRRRLQLLERAHDLVSLTMRNLGTPGYPIDFLADLVAREPSRWFLWVVEAGEEMAAAVLCAAQDGIVYPTISGADPAYRSDGHNNFLYATLMEHAIERGLRSFDFGRSKLDTGAFHFKRHFGFEPRPLRYAYYLVDDSSVPNLSPANPSYRLAISLWRRFPLAVAKLVGPRLVGHFA